MGPLQRPMKSRDAHQEGTLPPAEPYLKNRASPQGSYKTALASDPGVEEKEWKRTADSEWIPRQQINSKKMSTIFKEISVS